MHTPVGVPRRFRAILRSVLPSDSVGSGIINELAEEFARDCRTHGRRTASARYRRRAVEIAAYALWDRIRGRVWARSYIGEPAARTTPVADTDRLSWSRRGVEWIRSVAADLRYAFRSMRKRPGFTAVLATTVAVGLGVNVSIFTLANEILLRPLPIGAQEDVVDVFVDTPTQDSFGGFSYPDYRDYRDRDDILAGLAAFHGTTLRLGSDGPGPAVSVSFVTGDYLDVLQVRPQLGRRFLLDELAPGGANAAAIVSHGFWQRVLGGRRDALGSALALNGEPVVVIGVLPQGFSGTFIGFPTDVWLPLAFAESQLVGFDLRDVNQRQLEFIGRLQPGVSVASARSALNSVAASLDVSAPLESGRRGVDVARTTGVDHSLRRGVIGFLGVLLAVTGIVLLIVCLNVGNMLMAQAASRHKEMATRLALGARQSRLVRQLLAETLAVFMLGGVGALLVARWASNAAMRLLAATQLPLNFDLAIDWRVWLFAIGLALVAACIAVLLPARNAFTRSPATVLRASAGSRQHGRAGMSKVFVVAQVMGAVILTAGAGLFLRSVQEGVAVDPGFDADRVLAATVTLEEGEDAGERRRAVLQDVQDRLLAQPTVEGVAFSMNSPVGVRRQTLEIQVPGREPPPGESGWHVEGKRVGENYFATLGIGLVSGRAFDRQDRMDQRRVAIVTNTMARQFWAGEDPVGRSFFRDGKDVTIIGVVRDSRYLLQEAVPGALLYQTMPVTDPERVTMLIRTVTDPAALRTLVSSAVAESDPALTPPTVSTLREQINQSLFPQRVAASVIGFLGAFGLVIASLGIYGVLAHFVALRNKEIAIRLAVGGRTSTVIGLVVGAGFRLVLSGLALGVLASLGLLPLLRAFLVGVRPTDPVTFVAVSGIVLIVALAACLMPALRAVSVDPARVLRMD